MVFIFLSLSHTHTHTHRLSSTPSQCSRDAIWNVWLKEYYCCQFLCVVLICDRYCIHFHATAHCWSISSNSDSMHGMWSKYRWPATTEARTAHNTLPSNWFPSLFYNKIPKFHHSLSILLTFCCSHMVMIAFSRSSVASILFDMVSVFFLHSFDFLCLRLHPWVNAYVWELICVHMCVCTSIKIHFEL